MGYKANKEAAVYMNDDPTLTDQASARDTDINVIVKQYRIHGQVPGHNKQHIDMDLSLLPSDFRTMIELTRELGDMYRKLPRELRDLGMDELTTLTTEQIYNKLTPPQPVAKKEEAK